MELFDKFSNQMHISFKGEVYYELVDSDTGIVKKTHTQPNIWFDQGTRNFINNEFTTRLFLSSSTNAIDVRTSSIGSILAQVDVSSTSTAGDNWRSYSSGFRRWTFKGTYSPPASNRNITRIGLSAGLSGANAYCCTTLSEILTQTPQDTLYVYYYVYVNVNGVLGCGSTSLSQYAAALFGSSSNDKGLNTGIRLYFGGQVNDKISIDDIDGTIPNGTSNNRAFYSDAPDIITNVIPGTATINASKFRKHLISPSLGSSADLSSWVTRNYTGLKTNSFGHAIAFKGKHIGRIWPKANASTEMFFDSASNRQPTGFWRAFGLRAKSEIEQFPFYSAYMHFLPAVSGGLDTGKYVYTQQVESMSQLNITSSSGSSTTSQSECVFRSLDTVTKFGKDLLLVGVQTAWSSSTDTGVFGNSHFQRGFIMDSETMQVRALPPQNSSFYWIHDDITSNFLGGIITGRNPDTLARLNDRAYGVRLWRFNTNNWKGSVTSFSLNTRNNKDAFHAQAINMGTPENPIGKYLFYFRLNPRFDLLNPETQEWEDYWLSNYPMLNALFTYGGYLKNRNLLIGNSGDGLYGFSANGDENHIVNKVQIDQNNNLDVTSNLQSFSLSRNQILSLDKENNKLEVYSFGFNTIGKSGHFIKNGPFELECSFEDVKPYLNGQEAGLCVMPASNIVFNDRMQGKYISFRTPNATSRSAENMIAALEGANGSYPYLTQIALTGSGVGGHWTTSSGGSASNWHYSNSPVFQGATSLRVSHNSTWSNTELLIFNLPASNNKVRIITMWARCTGTTANANGAILGYADGVYQYYHKPWATENDNNWYLTAFRIEPWVKQFSIRYQSGGGSAFLHVDAVHMYNLEEFTENAITALHISGFNINESGFMSPRVNDNIASQVDLNNPSGRLRLARDANNIIRTSYSLDNGSSWIQINNEGYTVSGPVFIGLFSTDASSAYGTFRFKINEYKLTGDFDRRIVFSPGKSNNNEDFFTKGAPVEARSVSKYCHAIEKGGDLLIAKRDAIVRFDPDTYEAKSMKILLDRVNNTSYPFYQTVYVYNDDYLEGDKSKAVYVGYRPSDPSTSSLCQERHVASQETLQPVKAYFLYDPANKNWVNVTYPIPDNSANAGNATWISMVFPFKGKMLTGRQWSTHRNVLIDLAQLSFKWDNNINKWVIADNSENVRQESMAKPMHLDWQDLHPYSGDLQTRNVLNPQSAENTFSENDKYSVIVNQDGFSKDNQQFINSLSHITYFTRAEKFTEEFNSGEPTYTLAQASDVNFISVDTDLTQLFRAFYLDPATNQFSYWNDVIGSVTVTNIAGNEISYSENLNLTYNLYKGRYLEFNNQRRLITDYDPTYKKITIESPFSPAPIVGSILKIQSPAPATKGSGANQFSIVDSTGVITPSATDTNKRFRITYIALFRTW